MSDLTVILLIGLLVIFLVSYIKSIFILGLEAEDNDKNIEEFN